jgi:phosphohistidine phosphatase
MVDAGGGDTGGMRFYVMRHGPAGEHGSYANDFERPLTDKGREQTAAAARGLARMGVAPARIVSSPLTRALQTAQLAAAELRGGKPPEVVDALAAGATPGEILKALRQWPDETLLVGHEPDLGRLVSYVLGGQRPFVDFAKGGVVALETKGPPEAGSCTLLWYLRRKHLSLLGG